MRENTLLQTNILVCAIITLGFIITSAISYHNNINFFKKNIEQVSTLASDGIHTQINTIFAKPVHVSLTMAYDNFLKSFLREEERHLKDDAYIRTIQNYLHAYRKKYGYDSVFVISARTGRYYHFDGLTRTLTPNAPNNAWYYSLLQKNEEYILTVDNDEDRNNQIAVFVNCRITDADGTLLGIVGVGFQVHDLQEMLREYDEQFDVRIRLVDRDGLVQVSSSVTGYDHVNLFDDPSAARLKKRLFTGKETRRTLWYASEGHSGYVVSRYIPTLKWYLVVESDACAMQEHFNMQVVQKAVIIALIIALVLFTITKVLRKYNARIIQLTISQEFEYHQLLRKATERLYENIYEIDITHNRAGGENTAQYFESLGLLGNASYDEALKAIAHQEIKEEYVQGYLDTFHPDHVLEAYNNGIPTLRYDLMMRRNDEEYHWMRINAQIFYWNSDASVRMITYRENMDEEKKRELRLIEESQRDSLTGFYNKKATETLITEILRADGVATAKHAFLIFDIDSFKGINDTFGHAFGDQIITEFAAELKMHFRENDISGRIGGDEFVVMMRDYDDLATVRQRLDQLCADLGRKPFGTERDFHISSSIGVALVPEHGLTYSELYEKADQALYYSKSHGKGVFTIFGEKASTADICHVNQRDLEAVLNTTTDGLAKFACAETLRLLYCNKKWTDLVSLPARDLAAPEFDGFALVHPDDAQRFISGLEEARTSRAPFSLVFRLRRGDEDHIPVCCKGFFISEQYEHRFPVFYAVYTRCSEAAPHDESKSIF